MSNEESHWRRLRGLPVGAVGLVSVLSLTGCPEPPANEPASYVEPTLTQAKPADDTGSCVSCHPRQFNEWLGSSHNYGNGLDGTYQSLEITANYYAAHALGEPIFRQNLLCISCHAPSAAAWVGTEGEGAYLDSNRSIRQSRSDHEPLNRELARPGSGVDLLPPAGRAVELQAGASALPTDTEDEARVKRDRALLTFQGITCDSCHKVGRPLNDQYDFALYDEGSAIFKALGPGATLEEQLEYCEDVAGTEDDDPLCRRRSRGQHPHDAPFFDIGISNFAIVYERDGDVRFGPFPETGKGAAVPAVAHNISAGAKWTAPDGTEFDYGRFNIAVHSDGRPFEDQPEDRRPYLQSSQFCGACHDVRLAPIFGNEPVHNEPFYRLENLYTEWFISPLNLHPDERGDSDDPTQMWPDNPFRNEDGSAKRIVCQDCHMSLYPYAPPGTFGGVYTHPEDCDEAGNCGLMAATQTFINEDGETSLTTRGNARVPTRDRLTTHNMTGPDIALGMLAPVKDGLTNAMSLSLPVQTGREGLENREIFSGEQNDAVYDLPMDVDRRRQRLIGTTVMVSLAGTPEKIDFEDQTLCNDEECVLPVKAWSMNINGGHRVAAGFSQERQVWVELTVEDMGRPVKDANGNETGLYELVDCGDVGLEEMYESVSVNKKGYPVRKAKRQSTDSAISIFNRLNGIPEGERRSSADHGNICRSVSGHLLDKPHDETHEPAGDGNLDDEDILLHRIGNTLPVLLDHDCVESNPDGVDANRNGYADQCETEVISWHVADVGFDYNERFCSNGSAKPCTGNELNFYPDKARIDAAKADPKMFSDRIARADQFHVMGLDIYLGDLTSAHLREGRGAREYLGVADTNPLLDMPIVTRDGRTVRLHDAGLELSASVTYTPDERPEILYPFPEFPGLVTHVDPEGYWHAGERFGLAYLTNIFYRITGCEHGECEGPEHLTLDWHGKRYELEAQVHWPMTYPALPHVNTLAHDPQYHHIFENYYNEEDVHGYVALMRSLESWQNQQASKDGYFRSNPITDGGTHYGEAFTFVPLNSNHMPNNRSLQYFKPQRHYWDIRVKKGEVIGPIRITAKTWYRHFPPEFLRLMARYTEGLYLRAVAEGHACPHDQPGCIPDEENWFPHGPLTVEGEMAKLFPNAASIDNLRRILMDEAVFFVDVNGANNAGGSVEQMPANPTRQDVEMVLQNHCANCHIDVLRHGGLVFEYDDFPQWDVPGGQPADTEQDWTRNVVGAGARYANMPIVAPGDPEGSLLYRLISASPEEFAAQKINDPSIKARPMPLKFERISEAEIELVRRWIANGAK